MAPRGRRQPGDEPVRTGHLERTAAWAGLKRGDPVEVAAGSRLRSATWSFVSHVRNTQTGAEWVEVVGGKPGDRKLRSFRPEQVFPPGAAKAKSAGPASLAEAPQLPFG
jgi:hypothetical protein